MARWLPLRGLGRQVTVGLVMAVALLSVLTGIANIGQQTIGGPLAAFVPPAIQRTAGFTGALTGFLMITSALGLRRGLRAAWYSTAVLLPVTALQGLLQSSPLSLPLVALSVLAMPNLLANRRLFDREVELSASELAAAAAILGALVYGTVGAYALREDFAGLSNLTDAFYYTLVTASTVGYGDVTPLTPEARLFGMSVVVVGTASFAVALGTLLGPAIEARFTKALGRMTDSQLELLESHLLVLGRGELTDVIIEELGDREYLVVTTDAEWAGSAGDRGVNVLVDDPADEEVLERAGIDEARAVVVATNDDAEDALAVLTARQLNPAIRIVAAVTNRENVEKFRRAGADAVISPASIGGHLLVESALGDDDVEAVARQLVDDADEVGGVGPAAGPDSDASD